MNAITTVQIPQIKIINGKMTTTSRNIAQVFSKNHKHVIRDIESLDIPQDFAESNFGLCSYKGKNGQSYKMHNVTRDGFTLLAMGFTGSKAMQFKLGYIEAFNTMETELLKKYEQPALPSTITPASQRTIQEMVATLAHENKAYAKYYGALKTHFRVGTYKDIQDNMLGEALEVLQGVVVNSKAIKQEVVVSKPILRNRQFLYSYDSSGVETIDGILGDKMLVGRMNFKALVNRVELLDERYRKIIEVENNMFLAQQASTKAYISMMDFRVSTCDPVREANMLAKSLGK